MLLGASFGVDNSPVSVTFGIPKYAPTPFKVTVVLVLDHVA